jgi:hypothetical protein
MYSRIRKSESSDSIIKPMGPYRFHSTGCAITSIQSSGTFHPFGTISINYPIQCPANEIQELPPKSTKKEEFRMLMKKHKKTLELLAK